MGNRLIKSLFRYFVIISFMLIAIPAISQNRNKITLKMDNTRLGLILDEIERQTDYLFLCDRISLSEKKTIRVENKSLDETLSILFKDTDIVWKVSEASVYLSHKNSKSAEKGSENIVGTVKDINGNPIIGAGVLVKGTTMGASTDLDGKFSISLTGDLPSDTVLEFSCLGYKTINLKTNGRHTFKVTLEDDSVIMEGTVVTALGIKRSEKALSYNVKEISSDLLVGNKDANFINSLNGKVAGLNINSSSSGVGGASKVVMRGQKSISQSSNALYVIDGVPMYTRAKEGSTEFASQGSSDPIADINPEDIESISVLTGAAAAALYGSDAANGAIVVTTKKGKEGKVQVNVSSSVEFFNPFVLPRFQNRYGTGDLNSSIGSDLRSWGKLMNKSNNPNYSPSKDYFQLGVMHTESISLSAGTKNNQTYISASSIGSKGIVPNNRYERKNLTFRNTTYFLNDKMHLDFGASYIQQKDRNMTNQGTYNNPLVGAYLFPRGGDWDAVRMYERYDVARKLSTQYWPIGDAGMTMQNPYWINYRNLRVNDKTRFMLNASLSYDILDWLNVAGRVRMDHSFTKYTEKFYATTFPQLTELSTNGLYGITSTKECQMYADFLVNINKRFGSDWTLQMNMGASITDMRSDAFKNRGPIADGVITAEKPGLANVFNVQNLSNSPKTTRLQ